MKERSETKTAGTNKDLETTALKLTARSFGLRGERRFSPNDVARRKAESR
jgi:hypothetical protein